MISVTRLTSDDSLLSHRHLDCDRGMNMYACNRSIGLFVNIQKITHSLLSHWFIISQVQLGNLLWFEAKPVGDYWIVKRWIWYLDCFIHDCCSITSEVGLEFRNIRRVHGVPTIGSLFHSRDHMCSIQLHVVGWWCSPCSQDKTMRHDLNEWIFNTMVNKKRLFTMVLNIHLKTIDLL